MVNYFAMINIGIFVELERIKKPSSVVLSACQMFCMFANAFRDKPFLEDLGNWTKILFFINTNITKGLGDVLANIKSKVLSDFLTVKACSKKHTI